MIRRPWWTTLVCVGLLAAVVPAQDRYEDERDQPARETPPEYEGIWFTQRQMEFFTHRIVDDMAERYQFDEEQLYLTREVLKERVIPFMKENRRQLQPLINEFIEAQLGDEAPGVDYVADWAQRALPLMRRFNDVVDGIGEDMREYLTDDQLVIMEGELAAFHTGWEMITNKVAVWADGGYDPYTEWPRSKGHRGDLERQREQEIQQAMDAAREQAIEDAKQGKPAVSADATKDAWARYVDEFVRRYRFNDDQTQKAYRLLDGIRQKRDRYLKSKLDEMKRIEQMLNQTETDEDRAKVQAELKKLNAPVEAWFKRLKEGLQRLPTRAQRRAANEADQERRQKERERPRSTKAARPEPETSQER